MQAKHESWINDHVIQDDVDNLKLAEDLSTFVSQLLLLMQVNLDGITPIVILNI